MGIIFTPSTRTRDGKKTHSPHDGKVHQGIRRTSLKLTPEIKVTEYGILPPPTPLELKKESEYERFLSFWSRER